MAVAENLKATHTVDERVRGVANTVVAIDSRVAGVDDRVAGVDDRVAGVDDKVEGIANDVDQVKRSSSHLIRTDLSLHIISEDQLRENIHKWLSPPDPSTNHNIACGTHHRKTATWFFQGSIFREWKSTPSLLWIHGKRASSPTSYPAPSYDVLNSSRLRQEYSLVSKCLALSIMDDQWLLSVPRSSKILKPCARPETRQWPIFILTFGTPASKACMTWSLPFSPNFLLARATAAISYPNFIRFTTAERNSLVMIF